MNTQEKHDMCVHFKNGEVLHCNSSFIHGKAFRAFLLSDQVVAVGKNDRLLRYVRFLPDSQVCEFKVRDVVYISAR